MNLQPNTRGGRALRAGQRARRWAHRKVHDPVIDPVWNRLEAEKATAEAEDLLKPPDRLLRSGGEVVAHVDSDAVLEPARSAMINTLESPNMIGVEASDQRLEDAFGAGVLQTAVDATVSAQAENSLEKMLCHQMAAAHHVAMKLLARALPSSPTLSAQLLPPVEQVRLTNAAARMMQVYQEAFLTLQKIRTGGKQTVVVQHVQVSGGQAVIAGNVRPVNRGAKREGGGAETK